MTNLATKSRTRHLTISILYGVLIAMAVWVALMGWYPDQGTAGDYVKAAVVIGIFGMLSWLFAPIGVAITVLTGGTVIWGAYNGEPVSILGTVLLIGSTLIPVLLNLRGFFGRYKQEWLSG